MRFVKYSLEGDYGAGPRHYVAFGHAKDRLKVHEITPSGLKPIEMRSKDPDDPLPLYYPSVLKWVDPIRLSCEKQMTKKAIVKKYGPVLTRAYVEKLRMEQIHQLENNTNQENEI